MAKGLPRVAYFCMEYGLHEDFKIYSGGLGILAGDIIKAAKDLNYPLVAVGILWRQGYTTQRIDEKGMPYDCFYEYQYDFLKDTGITVNVLIRGKQVKLKVWKCDCYENADLYLLDANIPGNNDTLMTGQLYGWFSEERIAQEIILGIGGIKALRALGIKADIYHFNDSHPLLAGLELIREKMINKKMEFEKALEQTKKQVVFTTHTPVIEGNEYHEHELLQYMGAYNGLSYGQMLKLGGSPFSMTAAGLRISKKANAVAALHCETARKMWREVVNKEHIIAITNGVHNKTWQDNGIINSIDNDEDLWQAHSILKKQMIDAIYDLCKVRLSEDILTIGFGRRAAPYKRGDLIFSDKERIEPLLKEGKLQIIFSGKAHPNDLVGKKIVANLYNMSRLYPESVVFVQNYDISIGKLLTRSCDVWLNNPVRPMEASGTSGMKAAMNGVLNLSVLDGWWPEGCEHGVNGWQIGNGYEGEDCNIIDADSLYKVLTEEILPCYYSDRQKWIAMMKSSINMSTYKFSAERMVDEYYRLLYR